MDRLSDRSEIKELTYRYAFYADTFAMDKMLELWVSASSTLTPINSC